MEPATTSCGCVAAASTAKACVSTVMGAACVSGPAAPVVVLTGLAVVGLIAAAVSDSGKKPA